MLVHPTILLDCDGVILDLAGAVHRTAQKALGRKLPSPTAWTTYDFREAMQVTKSEWEFFAKYLSRKDRIGYQIPFYPSAPSFVEHLGFGHKVVFATAPWRGLDHWVEARLSVLNHYLGRRNYSIVFTHDKHHIEGLWHIDDKWENLAARPERGILFLREYNLANKDRAAFIAANYTDVLAIVEKPAVEPSANKHAVIREVGLDTDFSKRGSKKDVQAKPTRKAPAKKRKR